MKTAVKELIKQLENFKKFPMVDKPTIEAAIDFAKLAIEPEKQQIIDAVVYGQNNHSVSIAKDNEAAQNYYTKTFNE